MSSPFLAVEVFWRSDIQVSSASSYVFTGVAVIIGGTVGYSASHVPKATNYIAEQARVSWSNYKEQGRLAIEDPGFKSPRLVAFEGTEYGSESDATEVPPYRAPVGSRRSF